MENWIIPVLVALVTGPSLGALTNWWIKRRQASGSINTSQAAELWAESNKLRAEYKERAEKLEARLEEVNNQLTDVMAQLNSLKVNSAGMEAKIAELQRIIKELRAENQRLLALKRDDI